MDKDSHGIINIKIIQMDVEGMFLMDKDSHGIINIKDNSDGCGGGYSS
jgi:hypothetical protein